MLELIQISSGYKDRTILNHISLKVPAKTIVAVLGSNGSGKSTLLRTICRATNITHGDIQFMGTSLLQYKDYEIISLGISLVPEGRGLFDSMSVLDNLLIGAYRTQSTSKDKLAQMLDLFPELKLRLREPAANLSGGQQQMLAVARALMSNPKLLLLDEPSLGLSPLLVSRVYETLDHACHTLGISVVVAEQNINMALKFADTGIVLDDGCIIMQDTSQRLLGNSAIRESYGFR